MFNNSIESNCENQVQEFFEDSSKSYGLVVTKPRDQSSNSNRYTLQFTEHQMNCTEFTLIENGFELTVVGDLEFQAFLELVRKVGERHE